MTSAPPKDYDVEKRVTGQAVPSVDASADFARCKEIADGGSPICIYDDPPILIVERRVDQHRISGDIDSEAPELSCHGRKTAFYRAGSMDYFYHRGVQPDASSP